MNRPTLVITALTATTRIASGASPAAATTTASGKTIVTLHAYGVHFQHEPGGATDPAVANPSNEIRLDFTTCAAGNGANQAVAGMAGPRLAGMTVEF